MTRAAVFLLATALLACGDADADGGAAAADGTQLSRSASRLARALERDADGAEGDLVEALARVADKPAADALPDLLTLTGHPSEEVRFNVVLALRAVGGEQAVAALSVMAAEDESELVRLEAGQG